MSCLLFRWANWEVSIPQSFFLADELRPLFGVSFPLSTTTLLGAGLFLQLKVTTPCRSQAQAFKLPTTTPALLPPLR